MATITRYVNPASADGGDGTTNATAGGNRAYHSLADWEGHEQQDLTDSGGDIALVYCETDGTADDHACTINGWTTGSASYIDIRCVSPYRHAGVWDTSKYRLVVADTNALQPLEDYVRIDGLQLGKSSSSVNSQACLIIWNITATNNQYYVSNCILKQAGNNSYFEPGIYLDDTDLKITIWNTIIYGLGTANNITNSPIRASASVTNVYNCTLIGGYTGIACIAGTVNATNVYAGNTTAEDFLRSAGTLAKTNCASEDQSADDTGTGETATNCVAGAIAYSTATFTNVTAGSEDYHLVSGSGLIDVGASDPGTGLFSDDIDGVTRSGTWDIGADEYVAAAGGTVVPQMMASHARRWWA